MSRVFEALTRASGEKKQAGAANLEKPWVLQEGLAAEAEPSVGLVPDNGSDSVSLPKPSPLAGSWREKVDDFLFGRGLDRYQTYPIVAVERGSPAAEQYKILREQLKRLRSENGTRFVSVTSPVKQDGKTTVAVNLAVAMALDTEEQVLLIDGDLRSSEVHRYFGIDSSPGLSDYLRSSARGGLMNHVRRTFLPNLLVLPAGKPVDLSSELLAQEKMRDLVEEIHSRFASHQIIVDTCPVLSTPDPLVLAPQVDGIIMVVRAGKTPRSYLTKALQCLNSGKVLGVVLNGMELGMDSKYYHAHTGAL